LEAYRSLAGQQTVQVATPQQGREIRAAVPIQPTAGMADSPSDQWLQRLATLDWRRLGDQLTRDGFVCIAEAVDASICGRLRGMFDDDTLFAKSVVMDRPDFGRGEYRYFRAPIPAVVDQLRRAVYPHVARIANDWQQLLDNPERYPAEWSA